MFDRDWNDRPIEVGRSVRGVLACMNPWDGLVRAAIEPWPPPELVQKLYQSRQARAFREADFATVTRSHGFYSDLQSIHSEDALTWSLFGPIAYADFHTRDRFSAEFLSACLGSPVASAPSHVWLWRRLPHPDTLVSGGPEIDFGVQTADCLALGEAKWRSGIGVAQGATRTKDQIQLRVEFCQKYGTKLFPGVKQFIVLLVGQRSDGLSAEQSALSTDRVRVIATTWDALGELASNPWRTDFVAQLAWRRDRSQAS